MNTVEISKMQIGHVLSRKAVFINGKTGRRNMHRVLGVKEHVLICRDSSGNIEIVPFEWVREIV